MDTTMIVKVCGMRESDNIRALDEMGCVHWMGFIFHPASPRYVDSVPKYLPQNARRVGVFVNATVECVCSRQKRFALDVIQLHGNESAEYCKTLRMALPEGTGIIKTIAVENADDLVVCSEYEGVADFLLFETKCKEHGGSGRKFNWHILSNYHGRMPFLLTGGIGPEDACRVREFRHPMFVGIDLNSRFECRPGVKDITAVSNFCRIMNNFIAT